MVKTLLIGLFSTVFAAAANAQSRQQQTDNLINQLQNFTNSPSNVSGAQNLVNQSNSYENGTPTNIVTPGGQTTSNSPGGLGGSTPGAGALGAADDAPKEPPKELPKEAAAALAPFNGLQIQGNSNATTAAQSGSRPALIPLNLGVSYGRAATSSFGFTPLRQARNRPQQRATRTTGSYQAGP